MDLLCKSYADDSDEESEPLAHERPPSRTVPPSIPSKRPNPGPEERQFKPLRRPNPPYGSYSEPQTTSSVSVPVSIPGRYVSKRERSLLASLSTIPSQDQCSDLSQKVSSNSPTVLGSISDIEVPRHLLSSITHRSKGSSWRTEMPSRMSILLTGHTKAVTAIDWSTSHVHLLASAGLDGVAYVWNVWSSDDKKKVRAFHHHNAPVKDVKWSKQGLSLLSCGYDCTSRLFDVEKGVEIQTFKEDEVIGVVKFHPDNFNLFLSGGSKGSLRLWDIRSNKVVHEYIRDLGAILDVEFIAGGKRFISSSDVSGRNISENAVIVWDISREVPLSNQVYAEAYTCPCIKLHPKDPVFIAQSNGNYTAIFSTNPPFKLNKYKRYEGHWVSGFPIKCNFSPDGETLVSGSSDGSVYIYGYKSCELIKKLKAYEHPCVDVTYHPVLPNVIASCSWNGLVSVFE